MANARPGSERSPGFGVALGLVALLLVQVVVQPWTLDDAYISFRYAENFASGHGLVYNPGEWVEGYTTFLWVWLLGWGHTLGFVTPVLARWLGLFFALCTVALVGMAHRFPVGLGRRGAAWAALVLGTTGCFSAWAMPGMEVPLVALLLTGTLLVTAAARKDRRWGVAAGVLGALAMLARPDSAPVVGLCLAVAGRRAMVAWALLYAPYFAWRFHTYGHPFPNTFYAKVGATGAQVERGLRYVLGAAVALAPAWSLALFAPYRERHGPRLLASAVVIHGLYVVAVGGDVMPAYRFFAPVVPSLALLAGAGLERIRAGTGAGVLLLVVQIGLFVAHPASLPRIRKGVVGRNGEEVGRWMREHLPGETLLATNTAGSVPYFSGFRTIDMLGLNDAHIAHRTMPDMGRGRAGHEKADGAYVFARDPDVVQFGSARGRRRPVFRSDRELFAQPGFAERYVYRRWRLPSGAWLHLYVRRSWVREGRVPPP